MRLKLSLLVTLMAALSCPGGAFASNSLGNRLTVLDEFCDIYYPNHQYPKLTTPQWIGEEGVDAVLVFAIDDMRDHGGYESYLRPILERLKQIDGRAPASIMANWANRDEPHLQTWLKEGVSLETHTADHPCPILEKGNFHAAKSTYDRCVDHFFSIPNNHPVAFRTPCMDGINSVSPRLFADILMRTTTNGNFLTLSTSIGMLFTGDDPELPKDLVQDSEGKNRYKKYLLPGYINYIENYPYPYLVRNMFWEAPFTIPDDYEGSRANGDKSPKTVADMKASIDAVTLKKGIWVMTFHPYTWIENKQVVEIIDYAVSKYGKRVKFLNLREVQERLDKNLLGGQSVRGKDGSANGVRLLDLNKDGFLDVVAANDQVQQSRVWDPANNKWKTTTFPAKIVAAREKGGASETGVRFGILSQKGHPAVFIANESQTGFWQFNGEDWVSTPEYLNGLNLEGSKIFTSHKGRDLGVRFRDINGDGITELLVNNPSQNAIFSWSSLNKTWKRLDYGLPPGTSIVTEDGQDNGLRFVDLNKDGYDEIIFSNEKEYSLWIYVPEAFLGFKQGWSREVFKGKRGDKPEIPMISRGGEYRNNGAWFAKEHLWVQNEDTAKLPDLVDRVTYGELLNGLQPPPRRPEEALQSIQAAPEYEVQLVAHEPAVQDPVHLEWSEDGSMWVVEMRDYPNGINGKNAGVLKRLYDKDEDGFYETVTVFLENLNYPTGVMPWRKGVLISAAPDILYAEDSDGDGKADNKQVLFTGFVEGNQQHRVNGFELGLDNWIYGANGDSGGSIKSLKTGKVTNISGRDFRFLPDSGDFRAISGQTQFGRRRDDWGNWFGGANYTWGWHYFLPEEYLARNPTLAVKTTFRQYAQYHDAGRVFPIGRVQQRFNDVGVQGHVTSGCSFAPYRDVLFGPEFEHSILICEPSHNAVHREVLEPIGVSFSGKRSPSEMGREFLASRDPWFRPVTAKTGPDGAIYIADMYRLVIEHPEWVPKDVQERMDMRAGEGMGRIYRVRPKGKELRKAAPLHTFYTAQLVEAMDCPNGWQRDTVQRLLIQSRPSEAVPLLVKLVRSASDPKVRLQALCTLDGFNEAKGELLIQTLSDSHPAVREHSVRIAEKYLVANPSAELKNALIARVDDSSLRVRYQLAFSLGEWDSPEAATALAKLAAKDRENGDMITAVLSSATKYPDELLLQVLTTNTEGGQMDRLVHQLVQLLASAKSGKGIEKVLSRLMDVKTDGAMPGWKFLAFASLLEAEEKSKTHNAKLEAEALIVLLNKARAIAVDGGQKGDLRKSAIRLLGREKTEVGKDVQTLASTLTPQTSLDVQLAVLARLSELNEPSVPNVLLERWRTSGPQVKTAILSILLRREAWTEQLLDQVESGAITASDLGASVRQELLSHSSNEVRARAEKHFKLPADASKNALISSLIPVVSKLNGDTERGRGLFELHCAACHRAGQAGHGAGPNLAMLYDHSVEQILTAVLDPNQAVEDKYRNYTVELKNGEQLTGILLAETGNSITIMGLTGAEQTLLRQDLDSLTSSSRSMMPEGFEQFFQPQDYADLIAFIRSSAAPAKVFPGNQPDLIVPQPDGSLRLTAVTAEIFGDNMAFEGQYRNLGLWNSVNDRAVWTLELPQPGEYEVWLDWACHENTAGNKFILQAGQHRLTGTVPSTGTWDIYQQKKFGMIKLAAGRQRLVFKSDSDLRGHLIDLREIRLVRPGSGTPVFASAVARPDPNKRKTVPGNRPEKVDPDANGNFKLLAGNCEIYGDKIAVYEPQRCLGWWTGQDDRVVWTLDVPKAGQYEVWMEWAITDEWANNKFELSSGSAKLVGTVPSTGGFEHYKTQSFGRIDLSEGEVKLTMRSAGPINGELADVRGLTLKPVK